MPELIVSLDVINLEQEKKFFKTLFPVVKFFKIGSVLFTSTGPESVKVIKQMGGKVFLDLKFYDIPNVVESAVRSAVSLGVDMLNVHTGGGKKMMESAARGCREQAENLKILSPILVGVTVLTSFERSDLQQIGVYSTVKEQVMCLARIAKQSGLSGVVASVEEVPDIKNICGKNFITVTPGIRLKQSEDDQKRTATPSAAKSVGTDYIVVGRPVLLAQNPLEMCKNILRES